MPTPDDRDFRGSNESESALSTLPLTAEPETGPRGAEAATTLERSTTRQSRAVRTAEKGNGAASSGVALPAVRTSSSRLCAVPLIEGPTETAHSAPSFVVDYLRVLQEAPQRTLDEMEAMHKSLVDKRIQVGGRPAITHLRPDLISVAEHRMLGTVVPTMVATLERAIEYLWPRSALHDYFGLAESLRPLVEIDPRLPGRTLGLARLDGFLTVDGRLKFIEANVDSPAGVGYADVFEEHILATRTMQAFVDRGYKLVRTHRRERLLRALIEWYAAWRRHNGAHELPARPRIAITDWDGTATECEFRILAEYFEARGIPTIVCDPRAFTLAKRGGHTVLEANGTPVSLVYRRALVDEIAARADEVRPLIEAARRGLVCMVNPLRAKVASSKALFELLSGHAADKLFSAEQNRVRHAVLPWTHRLKPGFVTYRGEKVDLIRLVRQRRPQFVLKPAAGRSGKGVHIGWDTEPRDWEHYLHVALTEGTWVVQEYVPIPAVRIPVRDGCAKLRHQCGDGLPFRLQPNKVNVGPFAFGGRYGGTIARLSPHSVINVSLGGAVVPTIGIDSSG